MSIIVKRQPLHRPSIQSPPTIPPFLFFDVIADKVHYVNDCNGIFGPPGPQFTEIFGPPLKYFIPQYKVNMHVQLIIQTYKNKL